MLIESWIAVMITIGVFILGLASIIGWIAEGERLSQQIEENKRLQHKIEELQKRIAHRDAIDNIRVANEYYNSKEN